MDFFNLEAEEVLLGTIILNNNQITKVDDILEAKHFYRLENSKIFAKIILIKKEDRIADSITLQSFFEAEGFGYGYLKHLISKASLIVNIRSYGVLIKELWTKRELMTIAKKIEVNISLENDLILSDIDKSIKEIDTTSAIIQVFNGEDALNDWQDNLGREFSKPIPSGLESLDKMLNGGFHKEGLYVFGAGSGTGKTFFSQKVMLEALKLDYGVFFASMEMSKRKIIARFFSILAKINSFRILINNIFEHEQDRFEYAKETWQKYKNNFFITEKGAMSPADIEFALKQSLKKSKIGLVVIDYAQMMKLREARNFNEASLIKENVNAIARMAQKYRVAIILLSQLTKDKISGKVGLGSLKGSGGLYEDADCVIAMWSEEESENKEKVKHLQMEVLKNRDGISGGFSINFNGDFGEFTENNTNIF